MPVADPAVADGMAALFRALEREAGLTAAGWRHARDAARHAATVNRDVVTLRRRHPHIDTLPVARPVFVTGLHRSGTTLMHRLLARHRDLRAPLLWEQLAPASEEDPVVLVARARRYVEDYAVAAPGFPAIHPLHPEEPDECHRLMSPAFRSRIYALRYRVPSYERWLDTQDASIAYRYHRTLLRCILWRRPGPRVVLKCPFHLVDIAGLRAVYPDAVVVRLHRDPAEAIPSACSLTATIRAARTARPDLAGIGREWLTRATAALTRVTPGGWDGVPDPAVLDVRYRDLLADPHRTVDRVLEFAGLPAGAAATEGIRAYLDGPAVAGAQRGTHRYTPADFRLDRSALDRRFAGYRAAFGID